MALNCADVRASAEFYGRFGFTVARAFDLGGGQELLFVKNGDVMLELFPVAGTPGAAEKDGPADRGTLRHLAFQVESVDDTLARLGDAAPVTLGPLDFDAFVPGWRTAWVRDPDGHIVEISQGFQETA